MAVPSADIRHRLLVTALRLMPFSAFSATTFAFGKTPPEASATVPFMPAAAP